LKKSILKSFAELPADTVPGAVVGRWCVATYEKNDRHDSDYAVNLYSRFDQEELQYQVQKSALVSADRQRFRLVFNDIDRDIGILIDRLEPLSSHLRGHTGIRALHGQKSVIGNKCEGENWHRGLRSGAAVQPHMVRWDGTWLHIDPTLLYRGGFDAKIIGNAKILVRQTGDRLIGAYDDSGLYHLNNIHSLSPNLQSDLDLDLVNGLLNSNWWLYLYRLKTREYGRALAQIEIETLESMPLPAREPQLERLLSFFARSLRGAVKLGVRENQQANACYVAEEQVPGCVEDSIWHGRANQMRRSIDRLVYDLYKLEARFIEQIEQGCGKLTNIAGKLPSPNEVSQLAALMEAEASADNQREGELCPSPAT
jgi:hypothetical protein